MKIYWKKELANGWRLACKAIIQRQCVVSIEMSGEEKYAVVTEYASERKPQQPAEKSYYGIAVDIGTTTIAMQLLELHSKTIEVPTLPLIGSGHMEQMSSAGFRHPMKGKKKG